jgi:hypothetical protein
MPLSQTEEKQPMIHKPRLPGIIRCKCDVREALIQMQMLAGKTRKEAERWVKENIKEVHDSPIFIMGPVTPQPFPRRPPPGVLFFKWKLEPKETPKDELSDMKQIKKLLGYLPKPRKTDA